MSKILFNESPPLDVYLDGNDRTLKLAIFNAIESSNPPGSSLVLTVKHEIPHSPGLTWHVEHHFYIVETTPSRNDSREWTLFYIAWDDNEGTWERDAYRSVSGAASDSEAADLLLAEFFQSMNLEDDDAWAIALGPYRERAAAVLS